MTTTLLISLVLCWAGRLPPRPRHARSSSRFRRSQRFTTMMQVSISDQLGNLQEATAQTGFRLPLANKNTSFSPTPAAGSSPLAATSTAQKIPAIFSTSFPHHPLIRARPGESRCRRGAGALVPHPEKGAAEVLYSFGATRQPARRRAPGAGVCSGCRSISGLRRHRPPRPWPICSNRSSRVDRRSQPRGCVTPTSPRQEDADIQIGLVLDGWGRTDGRCSARAVSEQRGLATSTRELVAGSERATRSTRKTAATYDRAITTQSVSRSGKSIVCSSRGICLAHDQR